LSHAATIASELAPDGEAYHGWALRAVHERGDEVAYLPIGRTKS
jgi:hypothetical protein